MSISKTVFRTGLSFFTAAMLLGCASSSVNTDSYHHESRWFNSDVFKNVGTSPYDLAFENEFYAADNSVISIKNCSDVILVGEQFIAENEYSRWQLLKTDCEAVNRFYSSPETAARFWPKQFDFSLLQTMPALAIPNLGGEGLDDRKGHLADAEPTLRLLESGAFNVKVSYDSMVVNYVVVARGDFNRDGFQDLFVRMDWYIEDAFGSGHDWIVLTKLSHDADLMMLWRK